MISEVLDTRRRMKMLLAGLEPALSVCVTPPVLWKKAALAAMDRVELSLADSKSAALPFGYIAICTK